MNQQNLIKTIVQAIRQTEPKTKAYDTQARVTRIENGIAWVHIPGGVTETPVKLTISAKAGDVVQVRVSGGRAFLVGNGTAPPTDDHVAKQAIAETRAVSKVVKTVQRIAERAAKIAGNTNQYFWHTETGTDTGAHITEIPQEEFLADPANGGGNLLMRSNGAAVRYGLEEVAIFGSDTIHLGRKHGAGGSTIQRTRASLAGGTLVASYGSTFDLFHGDGSTTTFQLTGLLISYYPEDAKVYLDNERITDGYSLTYSVANGSRLIFDTAPASGVRIDVSYVDADKAQVVIGMTNTGDMAVGKHTLVVGYGGAVGRYSVAVGNDCTAQKDYTAVFGEKLGAMSADQTVIGKYNVYDRSDQYAFIVGNGNSGTRSNAFTVDWDGNGEASGKLTAGAVQSFTPTWESGQEPANYHCVVSAGICSLFYQGQGVAHSANTVLFTLPVGARPVSSVLVPFVKMTGGAVGVIGIATDGTVKVNQITNTSSTGRIYFNCTFPVV